MKLIKLYSWIAGSMTDFLKPFKENDALYNQARAFWGKLESNSMMIVIICLFFGIALAVYYYKPYNEKPGRHYTLKHWGLFLFVTFILVFAVTLGFEYLAVAPKINGAFGLEAKIALGNAIYASIVYLITSVVWCNALPTNAYRFFKF